MEQHNSAGDAAGRTAGPRPPRRALLLGLAVLLAASSGWSVVALLARPRPAATPRAPAARASPGAALAVIPTQPAADALGDLQMETRLSGWARRLRDGAVLHTDGGVLLWSVASPPGTVVALAPVDSRTARAVTAQAGGAGSTTLRSWSTADGGATWTRGGSFPVHAALLPPASLDFVGGDSGWLSLAGSETGGNLPLLLFHTADGGAHWMRMAATLLPPPGRPPGDAAPRICGLLTATFTAAATGWITGSCESGPPPLYVTHDAGRTWEPISLPGGLPSPAGNTSFPPLFTSASDGFLLTESEGADPVRAALFTTTDGGGSWALCSSMAGTPLADAFLPSARGWLVLDSAYGDSAASDLLVSDDGGGTWSSLGAFPYIGLQLDFVDARFGWAAPAYAPLEVTTPYLLQTGDGGRTWRALLPAIGPRSP